MEERSISKFDRQRGSLHNVAMFTKPSTIKNIQTITGEAETFVVETARYEDEGDYIFIECMDRDGVVRIVLPPKVSNSLSSQRDALTKRRRSHAAKCRAAEMTEEQKDVLRVRLAKARKTRKRKIK